VGTPHGREGKEKLQKLQTTVKVCLHLPQARRLFPYHTQQRIDVRISYKMSSLPAFSSRSPSSLLLLNHNHSEWLLLLSAVRLMSTASRPPLPSRPTSCAPLPLLEVSTLVTMSDGSGKFLWGCTQLDMFNNENSGVMGMKYAIHTFTGLPYDTPADDFVVGASDKALVTSILSAGTFFGTSLAVSST
jgi:hypothetical protein